MSLAKRKNTEEGKSIEDTLVECGFSQVMNLEYTNFIYQNITCKQPVCDTCFKGYFSVF